MNETKNGRIRNNLSKRSAIEKIGMKLLGVMSRGLGGEKKMNEEIRSMKESLIQAIMEQIPQEAAEKILGYETDDVYGPDELNELFDRVTELRCVQCGRFMSDEEFCEKNECAVCGNSVVE